MEGEGLFMCFVSLLIESYFERHLELHKSLTFKANRLPSDLEHDTAFSQTNS